MNQNNYIRFSVWLLFAILLFSGCSSESEFKGKIGMTCMDLTNPFFKLIGNVMQEEAAKYNIRINI